MELWISLSIFAYFLLAIESVADKFLITGRVKSWRVYLFYVSMLSLASILLLPLGVIWPEINLDWPGWRIFYISLASGVLFWAFLASLFYSLGKSNASRVFTLVGVVSTLTAFFISSVFFGEKLYWQEAVGVIALLVGGFFISFKFSRGRLFGAFWPAFLAGVLFGISFVLFKYVYNLQNFTSGYIFSRWGIALTSVVAVLAIPSFRRDIVDLFKKNHHEEKVSHLYGVVAAKTLAGLGTVILDYSIKVGVVTIVSALVSVQYLFIFLISLFLARIYKKELGENLSPLNVIAKATGVVLVVIGIVIVVRW